MLTLSWIVDYKTKVDALKSAKTTSLATIQAGIDAANER